MNDSEKQFARKLIGYANTHDDWLEVMRFGMPTLIKDQSFLFVLISEEASKRFNEMKYVNLALTVHEIFCELGLSFTTG